jgi:hypothetical protein
MKLQLKKVSSQGKEGEASLQKKKARITHLELIFIFLSFPYNSCVAIHFICCWGTYYQSWAQAH